MNAALTAVVVLVMVEHVWFLVLEMFLWTRPLGLKTFRNTPEFARQSAALAANQGLYNGFLAAGLLWGLCHPLPDVARQIVVFFLACVVLSTLRGSIINNLWWVITVTLLSTALGLAVAVLAEIGRAHV